ncbi:MAG: hypothetical protein H7329_09355 [Opitutaceae bacterium]|nr:hypothetical protein [Cytophagales bacterium]
MKVNTEPLKADTFYHIYNRGINGENIFKTENNYRFFLNKYILHIEPIAKTYAYCLLANHFHLLICTRSEDEIYSNLNVNVDEVSNLINVKKDRTASFNISNQYAKLFNSYTQAINKSINRTGGLFETPFRRIEIKSDAYFSKLIWYIHQNPQQHGFVSDFRDYPHSSYHSHLQTKATRLQRDEVLKWFGDGEEYVKFHSHEVNSETIRDLKIDFN